MQLLYGVKNNMWYEQMPKKEKERKDKLEDSGIC